MEYLSRNFWKCFVKDDGKFDGIKFEELVKRLLPLLGVTNLNETKISWDRSRDFEDKNKKIWAECKIYKDNISIRTISPTLVMAIIDKPNTIYFFSYSSLNQNAIQHLSQFQDTTKVRLYVFDDLSLEKLILSDEKITKQFFPDFNYIETQSMHLYNVKINFSKDPDIEYYSELIEDPKKKELYIHSVFSIDVFVRNLNHFEDLVGSLTTSNYNDSTDFLLLNKSLRDNNYTLDINVHSGGLFFYRFFFKVMASGIVNLPTFELRLDKPKEQSSLCLAPNSVKVSSIIRTPLIGKKYIEAIDKFRNIVQARNQPVFFNVYGESGTGKSRILSEYIEVLFGEEFHILKYDGEDTREISFSSLIKRIFSRLYKLPLFEDSEFQSDYKGSEFINKLLYNSDFNVNNNIEDCITYFMKGIYEKKIALMIDNLQNFDNYTLQFVDNLISKLQGTSNKAVLIICFNTNFVYQETKSHELFERLKLKCNNNTFINEEIAGFDTSAYELYLDSCVKPLQEDNKNAFSRKYPETTKLFKEKVLNRPLFIEQTLLYLEQEDTIRRHHNQFYVYDISKFHFLLAQDFPKNLSELLSKRWDILKRKISSEIENIDITSIDETIRFLCYFNKIDYKFFAKFKNSAKVLSYLKQLGFLKTDEREIVSFYHHQLFLFFRKYSQKYLLNELREYLSFIELYSLEEIYFYQYFIFSERLDIVNDDLLNRAIDKTLSTFQYDDFLIQFSNSLTKSLILNSDKIEAKLALKSYTILGRIIKIFENLKNGYLYLEEANKNITKNINLYIGIGYEYLNFIHELVNACIAIGSDSDAIRYIENTLANENKFIFESDHLKSIGIAELQNRLCVLYKSTGRTEKALTSGMASLEIAKETGNKNLELKNYIDLANVYKRDIKNKEVLLKYWRSAVELYHNCKEEDEIIKNQKSMVQLYEAQVYILTNQFDIGIKLLREGAKYCEQKSDYFFCVKYILIDIVSQISFNSTNLNFYEIEQNVYKAKDFCIRYSVTRTYWKAIYIDGIIHLLWNKSDFTKYLELFLMSFEQFLNIIDNADIEDYNINYIINLSCLFKREINNPLSKMFFKRALSLKSTLIKAKVIEIENMNVSEFSTFYKDTKPQTLFNDGKFDFPILG